MPCTVSIDGIKLERFEARIDNQDYKYPELAGGVATEPDAVEWFQAVHWRVIDWVGPKPEDRQPAGFGRDGNFASLHVAYRAPVKCSCPNPSGGPERSNTRYLNMTVDYDPSSDPLPVMRVGETQEDGSPMPGAPDKALIPTITQQPVTDYRNRPGLYVVSQVHLFIPCPCSAVNPCETTFELGYIYVPEPS
jgi:hypothetical protein